MKGVCPNCGETHVHPSYRDEYLMTDEGLVKVKAKVWICVACGEEALSPEPEFSRPNNVIRENVKIDVSGETR